MSSKLKVGKSGFCIIISFYKTSKNMASGYMMMIKARIGRMICRI